MGEIPTDFTSPQVGEIKCYTVILPLFFFFFFSLLVVQAFDLLFREKNLLDIIEKCYGLKIEDNKIYAINI